MVILDYEEYEITHPLTRKKVTWSGERIKKFASTYGVKIDIEIPEVEEKPKPKKAVKKSSAPKSKAKKTTVKASKIEPASQEEIKSDNT